MWFPGYRGCRSRSCLLNWRSSPQMLINSEISEVEAKIAALEKVKRDLNQNLLGLKEEELELNDECECVPTRRRTHTALSLILCITSHTSRRHQ